MQDMPEGHSTVNQSGTVEGLVPRLNVETWKRDMGIF